MPPTTRMFNSLNPTPPYPPQPQYAQQQPPYPPQPQYAQQPPLYPPQQQQPPQPQPYYGAQPQQSYAPQLLVAPVVAGTPGHIARGVWSDGIFDCFDSASICVVALFLPFLRWSTTVSRLRYLSFGGALAVSAPLFLLYTALYVYLNVAYPGTYGTDAVESYGAIYFVLLSLMVAAHLSFVAVGAYYRGKMRAEYGVRGNGAEDCCWHLCCGCCAIAQEARHVDRDFGFIV